MPGLFSRRSRSVSTSRPSTPASSNAQSAAAQAFLASRVSQSNLSASAAAAALRSMTPPPTAVDQIQTKRMLNRQGSLSSPNNAPRGRSKGNIQRRSSSASMTERTFRSPSPGRPSTSSGGETTRSAAEFVPPVPHVPDDYSNVPPIPQKSHKRATSVDNFPQRLAKDQAARVQSMGRGEVPAASHTASVAAKKVSVPQPVTELERSNSNNSFNFSYPRGARPNSPPPNAQSTQSETSSSLRNGITAAEAQEIQYELNHTSQQPVKKKKKRVDRQVVEGSHLHTGTMGGKPTITPLAPGPPPEQQEQGFQSTAPVKKQKRKAAITGQASHFPPSPVSPTTDSADSDEDEDDSLDRTRDQRSKRASGALMKQPSVVREDWEGEQEEERSSPQNYQPSADLPSPPSSVQGRKAIPEANMARKIEEPAASPRSPQVAAQSSVHSSVTTPMAAGRALIAPEGADQERSLSRSPSRSAKFSNNLSTDITTGVRHEPPGRSVSPGKSALKYHSPSPQGTSPLIAEFPRGRDSSPSEATDVSTEGTGKRKKAVHVSFDSEPEVVGTAAEPSTPDEPVIMSPQNREPNKKWFGLKNKTNSYAAVPSEETPEEAMGHRPQLPTFGSVRKNRRDDGGDSSRPITSAAVLQSSSRSSSSSSSSSLTEPPTLNTSVSSDHAIGGILAREAQLKSERESRSPLPPQVTSVEGTGFASESDSDSSDDEPSELQQPKTTTPEKPEEHAKPNQLPEPSDVPVIAVQPATPGLEEIGKPTDQWLVEVPGSFPEPSDQSEDASTAGQKIASHGPSTGLGIGTSKASPALGSAVSDSRKHLQQRTGTDLDESSSDNDSIYSDAEEDLSDLEGDGFGSIDAVVHSPISPSGHMSSPPESPLAAIPEEGETPNNVTRTASWEDAQARWSHIAQQAKKASLQPAAEISEKPKQPKSKKKKKIPVSDLPSEVPTASLPPASSSTDPQYDSPLRAPNQSSSYPIIATKTSRTANQGGFRKSMRSEPEQLPVADTKRYSMPVRSENPPKAFRSSMRNSADINVPQRQIEQPAQTISRPAVEKKTEQNTRTLRKQPVPIPAAADSDSESSFKRRRRSKQPRDGRYTMKRSMRAAPTNEPPPPKRSVIRSLSPISRRPTSPVGGQSTMRTTLRGSMDSGTPTLRGQQQSKRSSLFGFGSREKSPLRPASATPTAAKFKSRVDDSDDEDGARPTTFKSRFVDSSDEDEPTSFRPVRGIPRKPDDGDSTDLEDSSDEDRKKSKTFAGQKKLQVQAPSSPLPRDAAEPASPSSPTSKKKRGLFGRFRKNKDDSPQANAAETISSRNATDFNTNDAGASGVPASQLGFGSEAEMDAMVEQMQKKLEAAKARSTSPTGKLQRRITPQRIMSDTLLPPKMLAATDEDRPSTSDAVPNGSPLRPDLGSRQPTSDTVSTSAAGGAYGRTGKKKKFPLLRRAFGLKD